MFWFYCGTNRQTDTNTQTDMDEFYAPATLIGVTKYIVYIKLLIRCILRNVITWKAATRNVSSSIYKLVSIIRAFMSSTSLL